MPVTSDGRSLLSAPGILLPLIASVLLGWPMLILNAPLYFPDTLTYINQGHEVVRRAAGALLPGVLDYPADTYLQSRSLRSAPYAAFVYLGSRWPLHPVVPTLLQGAAVLFMLLALVKRELEAPRVAVALALAACALLTSLPWFVSFLVPDILAAAVILYSLVLVRSFDALGLAERLALGAVATFATVAHYGHIPLAAVSTGVALALLLAQRRLTAAALVAGLAPVALAVGMNAALGLVAYDGPSAAPRRLPLLLARSIEDGPARWHLEEQCATEAYAVCAVFEDGIPERVGDVLWRNGGLAGLDRETMARIRDEEFDILWRAFLSYPMRQLWSFIGNGTAQLVSVGTAEFQWAHVWRTETGALRANFDHAVQRDLMDRIGLLHAASVAAGLGLIAMCAWRDGLRRGPRERETLAVLAAGLVANAAIFGGLSAPADRYMSRVAWIVPALALVFLLERLRRRFSVVGAAG